MKKIGQIFVISLLVLFTAPVSAMHKNPYELFNEIREKQVKKMKQQEAEIIYKPIKQKKKRKIFTN